MPAQLEKALRKAARKKYGTTTGKQAQSYIYGSDTMQAWLNRKDGSQAGRKAGGLRRNENKKPCPDGGPGKGDGKGKGGGKNR